MGAIDRRRNRDDGNGVSDLSYLMIFQASPSERISLIRAGIPANQVKRVTLDLDIEQSAFFHALNLKIPTVNRKVTRHEMLSQEDGERLLGVARLVGQLQAMIADAGGPADFDASRWLSRWLSEPVAALDGQRPLDLLDTMEGQSMVAQALNQIQSGAYA